VTRSQRSPTRRAPVRRGRSWERFLPHAIRVADSVAANQWGCAPIRKRCATHVQFHGRARVFDRRPWPPWRGTPARPYVTLEAHAARDTVGWCQVSSSSGPAALRRVVLPASPLPQPGIRGGRRPRPRAARRRASRRDALKRGAPARVSGNGSVGHPMCPPTTSRSGSVRQLRQPLEVAGSGPSSSTNVLGRGRRSLVLSRRGSIDRPSPAQGALRGMGSGADLYGQCCPYPRASRVGTLPGMRTDPSTAAPGEPVANVITEPPRPGVRP
jgi:hypothetical protein